MNSFLHLLIFIKSKQFSHYFYLYFYLLKSTLLIIHIKLLVEINHFERERQFSLLTSGFVEYHTV